MDDQVARDRSGSGLKRLLSSGFLLAVLMLLYAHGAAAVIPPNALRYVHDGDGRLSAVIDPGAEAATYGWDPGGNLRQVLLHEAADLTVDALSPVAGSIGSTVRIEGSGFSSTLASNTVKFAGTKAKVLAAEPGLLSVEVPPGAESGAVAVSASGEGPVESNEEFTVESGSSPALSALSPEVAAVGDTIAASGSGLSSSPETEVLRVNSSFLQEMGMAAGWVEFLVPKNMLGGHFVVETPRGRAEGPDLFVAPPGYTVAEVDDTGRLAMNGSAAVEVATTGHIGLELVDGRRGERVRLSVGTSSFNGRTSIWTPQGSLVSQQWLEFTTAGGAFMDPVTLPEDGTYTVLVEGLESPAGSAEVGISSVTDQTGSIVPSEAGTVREVSISTAGQNARFSVPVSEGGAVGVAVSGDTFNSEASLEWRLPQQIDGWVSNLPLSWSFHRQAFVTAGNYVLVVNPAGADTGSVKLTVYDANDKPGGTLTPTEGGTTKTLAVEVPGRHSLVSFSGTEGEEVAFSMHDGSFYGNATLRSPKGESLASNGFYGDGVTRTAIERLTLPETGTYTLVLEGDEGQTGTVEMTGFVVKDQTGSITPSKEGGEQEVSIVAPGQKALFSVPVSAGETVAARIPSTPFGSVTQVEWLKPGGETLSSEYVWPSGGILRQAFATSGTYKLVIDPVGADVGSVDLTLYDATDITGGTLTPSEGGTTETFAVEVPGQHNLITFSGTEGEHVSLKAEESDFFASVAVMSPGNSVVRSFSVWGTGEPTASGTFTLPEAGTYTLVLEGEGAETGTVELTSYIEPEASWQFDRETKAVLADFTLPAGQNDGAPVTRSRSADPPSLATAARAKGRAHRPWTPPGPPYEPRGDGSWQPPHKRSAHRPWESGRPPTPWTEAPPLSAEPGVTALAGQVLEQDGLPLGGIRVSIEGVAGSARTDSAGRFLLSAIPAGHEVLVVGGRSGSNRFGSYEMAVNLKPRRTNQLEYTIWLTPLDSVGDRRISSPLQQARRIRSPNVPGLEVSLPAGTVVRDAKGHRVRHLNITAVPVDRPPSPLPGFQSVPLYFTIQPGRAYLSKGARIIYPNWAHLPAGQRVAFWNYDADDRGWYVYGRGTVSADGKQVVPDPGVRIWELTGAMVATTPFPPANGPRPGAGPGSTGGDPVDLQTGLFTFHHTTMVVPDTIPIVLEENYRQGDSNVYTFGRGAKNVYEMTLWSVNNFRETDVILPDGGRVHYDRISPGEFWMEAIYRSRSTPGEFYDSTISWDDVRGAWVLKLTSGREYVFSGGGRLIGIRNAHGEELQILREAGPPERITKIVSPHGRWVSIRYEGLFIIAKDNAGREAHYQLNVGWWLSAVTDPTARVTKFGYDENGQMTAIEDGRNITYLETSYDEAGRVEKQLQGDGGEFEFEYEEGAEGVEATVVTQPDGSKRLVEFNPDGYPVSETVGFESEEEETATASRQPGSNLILSQTDATGRKSSFEYDEFGNVVKVSNLVGTEVERSAEFTYQPGTSWLTSAADPLGHKSELEYGSDGEVLVARDAEEDETTFEYTPKGELTSVTDPEGDTSEFTYRDGTLQAIIDPLGHETRRFVDALGRVTSVADPSGNRTRMEYNPDSQLRKIETPLGATTTLEYDGDGNLVSLKDPNGHETTMYYDQMDRLDAETDALGRSANWSLDGLGRMIKAVDRDGRVAKFEYDDLGRMAESRFGVGGEEETVDYEYDEAGRPVHLEDSASGAYDLAYDALGQLEEVEGPTGSVAYAYDENGRREAMTAAGGPPVEYEYDKANRLTGLAQGGEAVSIEYDRAGRPELMVLPNGIEKSIEYNEAGRPIAISFEGSSGSLGDLHYGYDADSRLAAVWGSLAGTAMPEPINSTEYDAANELVERNGQELEYDKDGHLLSDGASEFEWNSRGELSSISGSASASFDYDPFGRRISKTLGGSTIDLLYDGSNVVQETEEGGPTTSLLTGLQADQTFARSGVAGTDSFLTDALGSTVGLTDESAELTTEYTYDPFGGATAAGPPSDNPIQFTGRENDGTGLQFNRARYYDPSAAGFISRDPSGISGSGFNLYRYAAGDPVDFTDPSGLELGSGGGSPFPFSTAGGSWWGAPYFFPNFSLPSLPLPDLPLPDYHFPDVHWPHFDRPEPNPDDALHEGLLGLASAAAEGAAKAGAPSLGGLALGALKGVAEGGFVSSLSNANYDDFASLADFAFDLGSMVEGMPAALAFAEAFGSEASIAMISIEAGLVEYGGSLLAIAILL